MDWPVPFPAAMSAGTVSVRRYDAGDAAQLLDALRDERTWEHIPRAIPADPAKLDESIQSWRPGGNRVTFTVRQAGVVVGMTSVVFDPEDPGGVEVGGTQFNPAVWGTGVNAAVKRLLFDAVFDYGAEWIRLRTDERNGRSAAAIRKLGATDLGTQPDHRIRRDGTRRQSLMFRLDRAAWGSA
jgi:RimJ/RimL family protein N-acetyltransferase